MIGKQVTVLSDKFFVGKQKVRYASKGDKVTVYALYGEVYLVKDKQGNRFSIHKNEVK
jgi:hypothetical protein